jgi:hypothetical protein
MHHPWCLHFKHHRTIVNPSLNTSAISSAKTKLIGVFVGMYMAADALLALRTPTWKLVSYAADQDA